MKAAVTSSSEPRRDEMAAPRPAAKPHYTIPSQQQQRASVTGVMTMSAVNKMQSTVRKGQPLSSMPTSPPHLTADSERPGAPGAQPTASLAANSVPGTSGGDATAARRLAGEAGVSDAQPAARDPLFSASIHAAAAAHSMGTAGSVFSPGAGTPPIAAIATTSSSAGPTQQSALPPPALMMTTATSTSEETAKAEQRQRILGLLNLLLTSFSIGKTGVRSLRECTSSLFVLLYQRLFDCTISGIDRSPNTAEKRRHNMALVLEQLRQHPYPIADIDAEEVVQLNEDHISRLIMVFIQVAEDMLRQQQRQQQQLQQRPGAMEASLPSAIPFQQDAAVGQHSFAYPPHTEDFTVVKTTGGAYAPVGYTVAEVMQPPPVEQADFAGPGGGGYHFHQTTDNFYVAPAPPLNGGAASGGAINNASGGGGSYMLPGEAVHVEEEEEESPSSVTHYLDSSVMPRDAFLEEWQGNLVYPPAGSPAEETEIMSAIDPGHVSLHGGHSQRPHPLSERWGRGAGVSLTSSGSPLYRTARHLAAASPPDRRSPASRQHPHHRAQLEVDDIVHRFQRLEEELDAQERRHRKTFAKDSTSLSAVHTESLAEKKRPHESQHRHYTASQPAPPVFDSLSGVGALPTDKRDSTQVDSGAPPRPEEPPSSQQRQHVARPLPPRSVQEPPLTQQERYLLAHCPQHRIDAAQRDRKIERLRSARYLGDMQQLLRRRMRREYDAQISAMRGSLKESIRTAREEKIDLMRRVRDENKRYRAAYATLMEAAANEAQVPVRVMSRQTAQLADYYATTLQHSHAVCESLKREADRRSKKELLRYAEEVSSWQQHFLL
ncbi:hypothetical protein JKF63_05135 [Porcisia hertigi]|uniref:Uncharacterized protein n=1 Tax=Porcisia hertigi TaxID=2761500 RepID=A0A836I600_9TRYP|nr:hypothetical protein JKF63_05135 [Porcisia hertigi]